MINAGWGCRQKPRLPRLRKELKHYAFSRQNWYCVTGLLPMRFCDQYHPYTGLPKYSSIRKRISDLFHENSGRYGYRRIHALLSRGGIVVSEKVVRRIMSENGLAVRVKSKRKYNSYQGEISPSVPNTINREGLSFPDCGLLWRDAAVLDDQHNAGCIHGEWYAGWRSISAWENRTPHSP